MDINKRNDKKLKLGVIGCVIVIIVLTVLEFPAPVGFETRPQDNVSLGWLILFLLIVITEIATIPLILKKPKLGSIFGIIAGSLNILQVIADQLHLMQPEVAPLRYSLLEYSVAAVSVVLIYLSLMEKRNYE
ncbi:MAG: hypothetical protein UV37_C0004G0048 [Candidatus Collierbacteria bacterium GW2011_GWA1_42_60]|uniref:Uncharacterized protein n=1 Tax=Candidatus Collierbacteria bacterium GW2011_GWA2_42_17 TaxID=1618378 RepID=A0A0G0Z430_9BACT|nr:MAG: hypothetical protein UU94_C0001G0003 [Candidatus Collierbacteria bacterium GW2011_GWB2_42_12]KKS43497.1 MAG: hypothetical protein UV06_C0001G0231 [Candidatus Collierbacteria bacterium GW2011_GWA2_42_17]KKS61627.1 MAG: hypothetical protein UV28_C0030G0003 [Candidatus Collierbacteria bacterium GW2011_GWE2_42_48]KKS62795.1 MAG: hypothetical protein UV29_C0010G0030 [Candidatus Collierbacteria bacterium GW2011_GWD2_42_50]KKS64762.1 MAG: hypothetical protein UV32_C0007G0030 [Candidatus Collie